MIGAYIAGDHAVARQARPDRTTVVYWEKWTGDEAKEMRKVVDAYNKSQDKIFVQYLSISGVDTKTMLATAGGNPPDVAGIWQEQVAQFADSKALSDLSDMAREAGLGPDYYIKGYYDPLSYHGKLWGLPSTPASIGLHVRPDLVPTDVGTPETFPKTLDSFDALVAKISTREPNGDLKMADFLPSDPGWWNFAWGMYFGGKLMDGDKLTIDSPENIRAFKWIAKYAK